MAYITSDTKFIKEQDGRLTLLYRTDSSWVLDKFSMGDPVKIRGVFYFIDEDLQNKDILDAEQNQEPTHISDFEKEFYFSIGRLEGSYYRIDGRILDIDHDIYLHKDIKIEEKIFLGSGRISIFPIIEKLTGEDMYIGGDNDNALPLPVLDRLRKEFPNHTEITKYKRARITAIIKDYYNTRKDYQSEYESYLNKKSSAKGVDISAMFRQNEIAKYRAIKKKLNDMLSSKIGYSEKRWQYEILEILLLLFPKYIKVFTEIGIKDCYTGSYRRLDYMLVDAIGNIDIVEIKKPFDECIVTQNTYRDNYIPMKEMSGTVMQIEKYILYLNKWGNEGEKKLTEKLKDNLPTGMKIQITNPGGIIIMGRTKGLTSEQLRDFEIVKRKYKNVIDIITYDDLLGRLDVILNQLGGSPIV